MSFAEESDQLTGEGDREGGWQSRNCGPPENFHSASEEESEIK
jgi:hypothetical protein